MEAAEIGHGVVIDLYPATDPAVGIMLYREPGDRPRTAHPLQSGIQPQGKQDLGGNRAASNAAFDGFDPSVQPFEILPLDVAPHDACPMALGQQRFKIARMKLHLAAVGHEYPRPRVRLVDLAGNILCFGVRVLSE